jgi:putative membrane protein
MGIAVGISNLLLTVLGFVVGLALSFRSSTAYERYNDGRKYWSQLTLVSQNLARLIWVHADERPGEFMKEDLLAKLTAINLICSFSVALKHKLRFEPFIDYPDLSQQVGHLSTVAHDAVPPAEVKKQGALMGWLEYLGVPMAEENPRKLVKNPTKPLGNLPLEILTHLSAYEKRLFENGTFKVSIYQTQAMNMLFTMNDVLTGCERVLNTPLPIAYSIAIGQITWVYILLLPFQLYRTLEWVTIPGTIFAAYIILGIALIGREIENPFGVDVNDLPLDDFCHQIRQDLDILTSSPAPSPESFVKKGANSILYPLSNLGYQAWESKSEEEIRAALRQKPELAIQK